MNPEPDPHQLELLEKENARLRRALEELSILNEVASAISSTSTLKEVVDLTVQKCVKHLNVEQGSVSLFGNEESSPLRTMVRKVRTDVDAIPYRLGDQLTGWMLKNQSPLVVNDLARDGRFQFGNDTASSIGSLMAVPLRLKGSILAAGPSIEIVAEKNPHASVRAAAAQHRRDRSTQQEEVVPEPVAAHVAQVEVDHLLEAAIRPAFDLPFAGQAGEDGMAFLGPGAVLPGQDGEIIHRQRARSDEAHLAAQDVE